MQRPKVKAALLILVFLAGSVAAARVLRGQSLPDEYSAFPKAKGEAAAPIRIVEFADFQCPSCGSASLFISDMIKKHPGQIHVEMKYYPLRGHDHAMPAARLAECARRQGRFWEMHNLLFGKQDAWRGLDDVVPFFYGLATEAGLDPVRTGACMDDPATMEAVLADRREGESLRIRSTPTFFVNGELVVGDLALRQKLKDRLEPAGEPSTP